MNIDFNKLNGLVPVIIQHAKNNIVLMLGFMNEEAFLKTVQEKKVTFFSRTKNRLWTKGEVSNNYLNVIDIKIDCDKDSILIKALPDGNTCHTGQFSCFNETEQTNNYFLNDLEKIIENRKNHKTENSYINTLFEKGINKIAQKVGEEAVETIIEAKDNNDELFLNESADLLFHLLILLQAKGYKIKDVLEILENRNKK